MVRWWFAIGLLSYGWFGMLFVCVWGLLTAACFIYLDCALTTGFALFACVA